MCVCSSSRSSLAPLFLAHVSICAWRGVVFSTIDRRKVDRESGQMTGMWHGNVLLRYKQSSECSCVYLSSRLTIMPPSSFSTSLPQSQAPHASSRQGCMLSPSLFRTGRLESTTERKPVSTLCTTTCPTECRRSACTPFLSPSLSLPLASRAES